MIDRRLYRPLAMFLLLLLGGLAAWRSAPPYKSNLDAAMELWGDILRDVDQVGYKVTRMSDSDEMQLGQKILTFVPSGRWVHDARATYVEAVGARLAAHVRRPGITYTFHVEDNPSVNAFALPGGQIVIFSGMLEFLQSEDELASVLGHEISHVDLRHCVEHYQLIETVERLKLGTAATIAVSMVEIVHRLYSLQYSKYQEAEADAQGARIAAQAGYDPGAPSAVFVRMSTRFHKPEQDKPRTPLDEAGSAAKSAIGGYFASHPQSADRAARLADLARHSGANPYPPATDKLGPEAYRARVGPAPAVPKSDTSDTARKPTTDGLADEQRSGSP